MLTRLTLTDFRNHAALTLDPSTGFVVLTGPNGAGKTNILEAVSVLAPGRGLRGAALSGMARGDGPGGWSVAGEVVAAPSPRSSLGDESPSPARGEGIRIGTGTTPAAPERRIVRINGAGASVNALAERLAILWLTPAMDRLFTDTAGARRRFVDRLVLALEPGHAHHAARYEAAMRARNKLLAAEAERAGSADPDWLTALEAGMAEHGAALGSARARTVAALGTALAGQDDPAFPRAALMLEGWDGQDLAATLKAGRGRDAAAGRTLTGPHRQDLSVTYAAKAMPAAACSTGEQKALLLGLILAHADLVRERRGDAPILLLDEVAAHLDPARRAALYARLDGRGQVWMTGTEASLFDPIGARARRIELGATAATGERAA